MTMSGGRSPSRKRRITVLDLMALVIGVSLALSLNRAEHAEAPPGVMTWRPSKLARIGEVLRPIEEFVIVAATLPLLLLRLRQPRPGLRAWWFGQGARRLRPYLYACSTAWSMACWRSWSVAHGGGGPARSRPARQYALLCRRRVVGHPDQRTVAEG